MFYKRTILLEKIAYIISMEDNTRKSCVTFIRLYKINIKKTFLHVHGQQQL